MTHFCLNLPRPPCVDDHTRVRVPSTVSALLEKLGYDRKLCSPPTVRDEGSGYLCQTEAQSKSSNSSIFTEQIDVKRKASFSQLQPTFNQQLNPTMQCLQCAAGATRCRRQETGERLVFKRKGRKEGSEKNVQKHMCMGQTSNRKPSILCAAHVWCKCNEYKRKIITNTGTSWGCFGIFNRLRLVWTKLMLKSGEQVWDTGNDLRFISYLIRLLRFKNTSDATGAEGGCRVSQNLVWSLIDERVHTWPFHIPVTQGQIQENALCSQ